MAALIIIVFIFILELQELGHIFIDYSLLLATLHSLDTN